MAPVHSIVKPHLDRSVDKGECAPRATRRVHHDEEEEEEIKERQEISGNEKREWETRERAANGVNKGDQDFWGQRSRLSDPDPETQTKFRRRAPPS